LDEAKNLWPGKSLEIFVSIGILFIYYYYLFFLIVIFLNKQGVGEWADLDIALAWINFKLPEASDRKWPQLLRNVPENVLYSGFTPFHLSLLR
jgi:hypothetical protein